MIIHLQAADAFSTAFIYKLGTFYGSFKYLPRPITRDYSAF